MTTSDREVLAGLGPAIARRIGEPRYQLWFHERTRLTLTDGQLVIGVPNCFFGEYLQKKFGDAVQAAAAEVLGQPAPVRFHIDPELFQAARRAEAEVQDATAPPPVAPPVAARPQPAAEVRAPSPATAKRHRRWHRLSEFVVGACNRLAHAAALSVIEAPGQHANPLVLHGPTGTGKTHLLEGIYAGLRKRHTDWRVCFVTAEDFTNRFVQAMHHGKMASFRKYFRDCDALLVDDLHFLATKPATQEEFLHTFDALLADGKPVVVTCDCHPRLTDDFSPEVSDRLVGGVVWPLEPPDADTRLALLRAKTVGGSPVVGEDVLRFLAGQLRGNVRELEGALHSVRHYSRVAGRPVDVTLAREALGELLRHAVRVVQLEDIDRAVCRALRLETGTLQSKERGWAVSHPRMLAMFLARKHTRAAYSAIGQHFGQRNHSTVVAAEKKVRQWLQEDAELTLGDRRWRWRRLVEVIEHELHR